MGGLIAIAGRRVAKLQLKNVALEKQLADVKRQDKRCS